MSTYVPSRTPEEHRRCLFQLASVHEPCIPDQHIVSQVLQRRFARRQPSGGWEIREFDLRFRKPYDRSTAEAGKYPHFVRWGAASAEKLWKQTEDRLPAALDAIAAGTLYEDEAHVRTIKDTIALHFARGLETLAIHRRSWLGVSQRQRQDLLQHADPLQQIFNSKYRLYPAGPEAAELLICDLQAPSQELYEKGVIFRDTAERIFTQAKDRAAACGLEIWRARESELVIGDVPAVTVNDSRPGAGVLSGIALDEATHVILPIGRQTLAVLGPTDRWVDIGAEAVADCNAKQCQAASERIFHHPAFDVMPLIGSALPSE